VQVGPTADVSIMGRRSTHEERPMPASPSIDVTKFPLSVKRLGAKR
jgi:hypothetical protein